MRFVAADGSTLLRYTFGIPLPDIDSKTYIYQRSIRLDVVSVYWRSFPGSEMGV
jgi:hypothetical protein